MCYAVLLCGGTSWMHWSFPSGWCGRYATPLEEAVGKDPVPELPAIVADLRDVA